MNWLLIRIPALFLFLVALLIYTGCHQLSTENSGPVYAQGTKEGYELAKKYCSSCHNFVSASNLDKETWEKHTLPPMAKKLGIKVLWGTQYFSSDTKRDGEPSLDEWKKILNYYLRTAPEKLEIPNQEIPARDSTIFTIRIPSYRSSKPVATVMTVFGTSNKKIYTSDAHNLSLITWNTELERIDSLHLNSPIVYANFYRDSNNTQHSMFTSIGKLDPHNDKLGAMLNISFEPHKTDTAAQHLARPVHTTIADMNNDRLNDLIVSEFGFTEKGGLYIYQQQENGKYIQNPVFEWPGAIQTAVKDFNNDGWNDIMALFAHDQESIRLFINQHNGSFKETKIMSFPPVNGSTSFQLIDFDNDGLEDIIYTCGDNADISQIFKPYHGIYIFINKGNFQYERAYFYQINGCEKAIAADFDKDGDLDIAVIAFASDFRNKPFEGFIYFEQVSEMNFKLYSPHVEQYGRWLTMDVNDYNGDGDPDIILGNFPRAQLVEKSYNPKWNEYIPFIILDNKTNN